MKEQNKMNNLMDIAQLTRIMKDKEAKDILVRNWDKVKNISLDAEQSAKLIHWIIKENREKLSAILEN